MDEHITAIEVDRRVAEALASAAAARGISLTDFLRDVGGLPVEEQAHQASGLGEFERWLDDLAAGSGAEASLPADFSRADVYDDHD